MFLDYLKLMRFHRPIGILLLLWPTLWALWIAADGFPPTKLLLIFILGVIVMRAAGCVMNDIADRHFDAHVQRTHDRPLAQKKISVRGALICFGALCAIALALLWQLNNFCKLIACFSLALAILYPFSKRWLACPQLLLGMAFASSVLMAFAAIQNTISINAWILFIVAVLWPIAYDTEYAMVDRADDLKIGLRSFAIFLGRWDQLVIGLLQMSVIVLLGWLGCRLDQNFWIFGAGLVVSSSLFGRQQWLIRNREPSACFQAFKNNHWVGLVIFVTIVLSGL